MDDLKVSYLFDNASFECLSDLHAEAREKLSPMFLKWEKKIRHSSAVETLNKELSVDSTKLLTVSVENKEESQTFKG
ncbi:hypothetical protein F9802_15195 [Bacillus aerolatus]|uniref:Uncharacterized protein n=1 Tax=Bacillus aerolatus TaxID=2653354 RepID=A0A6I1FS38_9BACI|nr:hypothetical protein [Bacillus aerolatus]KAB7704909.1 hypothetical protein F9802_15195 [Bacillus aerolatus]